MITIAAALLLAFAASQAISQRPKDAAITVEQASIAPDGLVHIQWSGQPEQVMPADRDGMCESTDHCEAVGAEQLTISSNKRSVGWAAQYPSCCQSYPLPWVLLIARDGRVVHSITAPRPVFDWKFEKGDARVAVFSDTPHGNMQPLCQLYSTLTWKLIAEWHPGKSAVMPAWAKPFAKDVNPDTDSSK